MSRRHIVHRIADTTLFVFFLLVIVVPGLGLIINSQQTVQAQEQRTAASWPSTSVETFYQKSWRSAITAYVNDRFAFRATLVSINNTIAVQLFHASPKLAPKPADIVTATTVTPTPTTAIVPPTEPTPIPKPSTTTPTSPPTITAPAPTETIAPPQVPAWKQRDVVVGKDGWLFLDQENAIDDYRCRTPFTSAEVDRIIAFLKSTQTTLTQQHIAFEMIIAPDKPAIYQEYLPNDISPVGTTCRMDQIVAAIKSRTTIALIDPRQILRDKKVDTRVYSKTDSHWNDIGAFTAYRAMMGPLQSKFPNITPQSWSDFTQRTTTVAGLDLARILSVQKTMKEQLIQLIPNETRLAVKSDVTFKDPEPDPIRNPIAYNLPGSTAPRALILRDSFTGALLPFLAETFSRTTAVWTYKALPDILAAEKPDVVILEIAQRKLPALLSQ